MEKSIGNGLCGTWHKGLNGHDEEKGEEVHHSTGLAFYTNFI